MKIEENFIETLEDMLDDTTKYKITMCLPDNMETIDNIEGVDINDNKEAIIAQFKIAYEKDPITGFEYVGLDEHSGNYHVCGSEIDSVFTSTKMMTVKQFYDLIMSDEILSEWLEDEMIIYFILES